MRKLLVSTAQIAVAAVLLLTAPLAYAQDGCQLPHEHAKKGACNVSKTHEVRY